MYGETNRGRIHIPIKPGKCALVHQLEIIIPGFVAQLKGRLTKDKYICATIFLDHYSSVSYVHLQRSTNGEDNLEEKKAFEAYARSKGVRI